VVHDIGSLGDLELTGIHLGVGILSIFLQLVVMDDIYYFSPVFHDWLVYFHSVMLYSLDRDSFSSSVRHTLHPFNWHLFIHYVVNVLDPFHWVLFFPLNRHLPSLSHLNSLSSHLRHHVYSLLLYHLHCLHWELLRHLLSHHILVMFISVLSHRLRHNIHCVLRHIVNHLLYPHLRLLLHYELELVMLSVPHFLLLSLVVQSRHIHIRNSLNRNSFSVGLSLLSQMVLSLPT